MRDHPYDHISDQELLERYYSSQNNQWLGILLQRYTLLLLGVCMKYLKNEEEAKDAVQHICLKVIDKMETHKVIYFKSWLYMVCRNHCLMHLRNRLTGKRKDIDEVQLPDVSGEIELEQKEQEQLLSALSEALKDLNEAQRTCIEAFYLQKKSYQEVADQTGFSLLQVKSYIQNGKRNLRLWILKNSKGSI